MSSVAPTSPLAVTPGPREGSGVYRLQPRATLLHPLTAEELATYRRDGFVIIRNLLSAEEVAVYKAEADALLQRIIQLCEHNGLDPAYNVRLEWDKKRNCSWKVDPFVSSSMPMAALAKDARITDRLCSIYDGYQPRLLKDKLIYKPPGSHGNSKHQDHNWWQGLPKSALTITVALDGTNRQNGCTQMWTGHKRGFLHQPATEHQIGPGEIDSSLLAQEQQTYVELAAGDAAIFNAFVPHAADANTSDQCRRAMFLSYNDSRDGEFYAAHYDHFNWYRTNEARMSTEEAAKYYTL